MSVLDFPTTGDDEPAGCDALLAAGVAYFNECATDDAAEVEIVTKVVRPSGAARGLICSSVLSLLAHALIVAGIYGWYFFGYVPPSVDLQSRRSSIALQASMAAAPDSQNDVPERPVRLPPTPKRAEPPRELKRPPLEIVRETPGRDPLLRKEPALEETVVAEVEPAEPERKIDDPTGTPPKDSTRRSKQPAPILAPLLSAASAAAIAVEGYDVPPQPHYNPKPPYPRDAYVRRLQGVVILELHISDTGVVEDARILESSGVASLDDISIRTVLTWRFTPARLLGRNVAVVFKKPIRFTHREAG